MHASMYACVYAYICMNVGMRAYMHENYTHVCMFTNICIQHQMQSNADTCIQWRI